ATGRPLWSLAPRGGLTLQQVAADERNLYVCSRSQGESETQIEAFSIETGLRKWRMTAPGLPYATDILVTDSLLAVALNQADPRNPALGAAKVLLMDKTTGETLQEIAFKNTTIYDIKVVDGVLLIVTHDAVIGLGSREPRA
ncbi:MAG: hypothetical protein HQ592_03260, partial [Planctomycetes bacterium]|nr:hypothetical protein [Planctomycetota bacterium]